MPMLTLHQTVRSVKARGAEGDGTTGRSRTRSNTIWNFHPLLDSAITQELPTSHTASFGAHCRAGSRCCVSRRSRAAGFLPNPLAAEARHGFAESMAGDARNGLVGIFVDC